MVMKEQIHWFNGFKECSLAPRTEIYSSRLRIHVGTCTLIVRLALHKTSHLTTTKALSDLNSVRILFPLSGFCLLGTERTQLL